MTPPLAIIQARMGSTRLPGKMLLPVEGQPLLLHVAKRVIATPGLGRNNVVVAIPRGEDNDALFTLCEDNDVNVYAYGGDENDVLGRFYHCAHTFRWHPDTVILRVTPDDPWKDPRMMAAVIEGYRLPVEQGGEAFTLAMLDAAVRNTTTVDYARTAVDELERALPGAKYHGMSMADAQAALVEREHIGDHPLLFPTPAPPAPPHPRGWPWSIDTQQDYDKVPH